jgi:TolA-binding protein
MEYNIQKNLEEQINSLKKEVDKLHYIIQGIDGNNSLINKVTEQEKRITVLEQFKTKLHQTYITITIGVSFLATLISNLIKWNG